MYKSKDIERWGSGIKRIHDECVAVDVRVDFKRLKTGFVVVFYRPKWEDGEGLEKAGQKSKGKSKGKSKVKNKDKVIRLIAENSKITMSEIAEQLDLSLAGVEKIIRTLKKEQRLCRIGPAKGGYWEVHD